VPNLFVFGPLSLSELPAEFQPAVDAREIAAEPAKSIVTATEIRSARRSILIPI
jgi:hypothetical protein